MAAIDYAGAGLLPSMFESCTLLVKAQDSPDGQFGRETAWTDGAAIDLMIVKDTSPEVTEADRRDNRETYIVVCARGASLRYGDVVRREKNGETLRITSRPDDKEAPDASTIQIARLSAERWDLP